MKFDPVTLASIVVFILLVVLAATYMVPVFDNPEMVASGPPLHKNTGLQLMDGESYTYLYTTTNSSMEITYEVHDGPGCTMITLPDAGGSAAVCLDGSGERVTGTEGGMGDPTVLLFRPWMLALNDSWTWNSSLYLSFSGSQEHISDTYYRVVRRDSYLDREAFLVEVKADAGEPEYQWIDAEKRISLRIVGEDYEVVLKNWSS